MLIRRLPVEFIQNSEYQYGDTYKNKSNRLSATALSLQESRKGIETLFSQLCDQFMIRKDYTESYKSFKTRILGKTSDVIMIQYFN